jgi:hypothetical protein
MLKFLKFYDELRELSRNSGIAILSIKVLTLIMNNDTNFTKVLLRGNV